MQVVETIAEVRSLIATAKAEGKSIGFVPTMGALHAGHASLIKAARAGSGFVAVSIFVNPTQFGPNEDLSRYPRTPQADIKLCRQCGADLVFMPSIAEMYPRQPLLQMSVPKLSGTLCGRSRPGHFDGVCIVVGKLFNIVQPDIAWFGAKDYQQSAIIRRMVADANFPVRIVVAPTVREPDGLAMSSRNVNLTAEERAQAVALHESLQLATTMIQQEHPSSLQVMQAMKELLARRAPAGRVDYIQIVDPDELTDVEETNRPVLVALAVQFSKARLIDNMLIGAPPAGA